MQASVPTPMDVVDTVAARQKLASQSLPVLSPKLLTYLEPSRITSRFDPAATFHDALQEPAIILAIYAQARRQRLTVTDQPQQIIAELGPQGILRVIASVRLVGAPTDPAARQWLDAGCRHALAVSRLAQRLAPAVGVDPDTAAVAGLLHDVGRMMLLAGPLGTTTLSAYDFARVAGLPNVYVERNMVGLSHKQAGQEMCQRSGVPALIADICTSHDFTAPQRDRLDASSRPLACLIALCDALANSAGLVGDPAAELRHPPRELEKLIVEHADDIAEVLGQVRVEAEPRWPLCRDVPELDALPRLDGHRVTLVARSGGWHPMRQVLVDAGAAVTVIPRPFDVSAIEADVIVLDASAESLAPVLEEALALRSASRTPCLMLAQRCHEPHERLRSANVPCALLTTPIRGEMLVRAVAQLAT